MDWKIPITFIIIGAVISFGILPFFSTDFSDSLINVFSSTKGLIREIVPRHQDFKENVVLSLSTEDIDNLKICQPTDIYIELEDECEILIGSNKLKVKQNLVLSNFTGKIEFSNFSISGDAMKLSSKNFEWGGKSKIQIDDADFSKLTIAQLEISELSVVNGTMDIESPQKIEAEVENEIKMYGFKGRLIYRNGRATLEGNCTKIQTKGFSIGE